MSKREILFKAKCLDNGEWVEGLLCKGLFSKLAIEEIKESRRRDVDPETVCQFTGLTDSDGKKVFEGDILEFEERNEGYKWTARVEFGNPNGTRTWGWQLVWTGGEKPNPGILLWIGMESSGAYSMVIGNVHDKEAQQ